MDGPENSKSEKIMKKRYQYTQNDFDRAVEYCRKGGKQSEAAKTFNIPKATLSVKLKAGVNCNIFNLLSLEE